MLVHWRNLENKSKSTAYRPENWNSSTTVPAALLSHWYGDRSTASSGRLCAPGRASAVQLLWVSALSPPTHAAKSSFSLREGFWCRRNTVLSSSWFSNLGESNVNETNRSFDRSRSKFADQRYRPRCQITKSVTVITVYNRTIRSGTAASAQNKMTKAVLHLKKNIIWKGGYTCSVSVSHQACGIKLDFCHVSALHWWGPHRPKQRQPSLQ